MNEYYPIGIASFALKNIADITERNEKKATLLQQAEALKIKIEDAYKALEVGDVATLIANPNLEKRNKGVVKRIEDTKKKYDEVIKKIGNTIHYLTPKTSSSVSAVTSVVATSSTPVSSVSTSKKPAFLSLKNALKDLAKYHLEFVPKEGYEFATDDETNYSTRLQ